MKQVHMTAQTSLDRQNSKLFNRHDDVRSLLPMQAPTSFYHFKRAFAFDERLDDQMSNQKA